MLNLTENEKRDIVRYIEEGKELPEKYRFLLFEGKKQVELLWNGKSDEVTNVVLPFQTIEHVDEPRSELPKELQLSLFDESGRQQKGWTNKLIWGDNKHILSSLKHGPMREEIEKQGGIKLILIPNIIANRLAELVDTGRLLCKRSLIIYILSMISVCSISPDSLLNSATNVMKIFIKQKRGDYCSL